MDIKIIRTDYLATGIFGELDAADDSFSLLTLEHAYPVVPDAASASTNYAPKIPAGVYKCLRGLHQLEGMTAPFETFEITGVTGHSNLLFHPGNFNKDSKGCILPGLYRNGDSEILHSRDAFEFFMKAQENIAYFTLTIS